MSKTVRNVMVGTAVVGVGLAAWEIGSRIFGFRGPMYWWGRLRNTIQSWVVVHEHLGIARVVGRVTDVLDDVAVMAKRVVNLVVSAIDRSNVAHQVTELSVRADELRTKLPGLADHTEAVIVEY